MINCIDVEKVRSMVARYRRTYRTIAATITTSDDRLLHGITVIHGVTHAALGRLLKHALFLRRSL